MSVACVGFLRAVCFLVFGWYGDIFPRSTLHRVFLSMHPGHRTTCFDQLNDTKLTASSRCGFGEKTLPSSSLRFSSLPLNKKGGTFRDCKLFT